MHHQGAVVTAQDIVEWCDNPTSQKVIIAKGTRIFGEKALAPVAEHIHIPTLDPKFVRDRNPNDNWWVERFNENISLLNRLAGNLPKRMPWRQRSVEQLKAECDRLSALGRHLAAYSLAWQDMLDQVQAFGLLSAWRLTELVSSAIWGIRRNDPLCAAIMARAAVKLLRATRGFKLGGGRASMP
jgi:hypothetical protein